MPAPAAAPSSSSATIAGKKISYDSIFVGLAGLVGVWLLLRGKSGAAASASNGLPTTTPDMGALENAVLSDPNFWSTLGQQQAMRQPSSTTSGLSFAGTATMPTGVPGGPSGGLLNFLPIEGGGGTLVVPLAPAGSGRTGPRGLPPIGPHPLPGGGTTITGA